MNILVIGCDQVGASLVRDLERIGHDISIIEKDSEQLKRLDAFDDYTFSGNALVGDPTDPDVLRQGGIENCAAVAAVSEDALPQGLRTGHHLPHRPYRAGRVPFSRQIIDTICIMR